MSEGALRIKRQAVIAAALTPIMSPYTTGAVTITNETNNDVAVHTNSDESEYYNLAKGAGMVLSLGQYSFRPGAVAFWLKAVPDGIVVLAWH